MIINTVNKACNVNDAPSPAKVFLIPIGMGTLHEYENCSSWEGFQFEDRVKIGNITCKCFYFNAAAQGGALK